MRNRAIFLTLITLIFNPLFAQTPESSPSTVKSALPIYGRIVDVGAGLATVFKIPNPEKSGDFFYFLYDTGDFQDSPNRDVNSDAGPFAVHAQAAIEELIPADETIDLIIESHFHSDHVGASNWILEHYKVDTVLRAGFRPKKESNPKERLYKGINLAMQTRRNEIAEKAIAEGKLRQDINLAALTEASDKPNEPATQVAQVFHLGQAKVTILSGFGAPLPEWEATFEQALKDKVVRDTQLNGMRINSTSVVARLDYGASSILLTGDAVGRFFTSPAEVSICTEDYLIKNCEKVPVKANIIVAPHHGADNASSKNFIEKVQPDYVIFPSGTKYGHPSRGAAERYLAYFAARGITDAANTRMFRTDLGDDEQGNNAKYEWKEGAKEKWVDPEGDDDVEVLLPLEGAVQVRYRRGEGSGETRK